MTDTVKLVLEQNDESDGSAISRVTCEWFGSERNVANAFSYALAESVVAAVGVAAADKAEVTGDEGLAEHMRKQIKGSDKAGGRS